MAIEGVLSQLRFLIVRKWGMSVPSVSHEWAGGVWLTMKMGRTGNKMYQLLYTEMFIEALLASKILETT